mmetsp:Transcript_77265/g.121619  ORF Transcript_77265/g.121619 Transcript_77265/m.121619 type:complete len:223 (+) Transcript_77265:1809-2477(+)
MRLSRSSRKRSMASSAASNASSGDETNPRDSAIAQRHSASIRLLSNSCEISLASVAFFRAVSTAPRSSILPIFSQAKVSRAFTSHSLLFEFRQIDLASFRALTASALARPSFTGVDSPSDMSILASPSRWPTSRNLASSSFAKSCARECCSLPTRPFTTKRTASAVASLLPLPLKASRACCPFSTASAKRSKPRRSSASANASPPETAVYFSHKKSPPPRHV